MKVRLDDRTTIAIILILTALFSFIFLGFTGFKAIFGMLIVFFLPFYLIMDNFELSTGEKIIFSLFIGAGAFPSIAYWMGTLISFKLSIAITFVLLMAIAFAVKRFKKPKS